MGSPLFVRCGRAAYPPARSHVPASIGPLWLCTLIGAEDQYRHRFLLSVTCTNHCHHRYAHREKRKCPFKQFVADGYVMPVSSVTKNSTSFRPSQPTCYELSTERAREGESQRLTASSQTVGLQLRPGKLCYKKTYSHSWD